MSGFPWKVGKLEGTYPVGTLTPKGVFYPCESYQHNSMEHDLLDRDFDYDEVCTHRYKDGIVPNSFEIDCVGPKHSTASIPDGSGGWLYHGDEGNHPECKNPSKAHHGWGCLEVEGYLHISGEIHLYNDKITKAQHDVVFDYYLDWKEKMEEDGRRVCLDNIRSIERFLKDWEERH